MTSKQDQRCKTVKNVSTNGTHACNLLRNDQDVVSKTKWKSLSSEMVKNTTQK